MDDTRLMRLCNRSLQRKADMPHVTLTTCKRAAGSYWVARWTDEQNGAKRSRSLGRTDALGKRQASSARDQVQREVDDSPTLAGSDLTVAALVQTACDAAAGDGITTHTLAGYRRHGAALVAICGTRKVRTITKADAAAICGELRKSSSGAGESRVHVIKHLFKRAAKLGLLASSPFVDCIARVKTKSWWRVVSIEEWRRIDKALADAGREDSRIVVALARLAGLRRADARALRWHQVDIGAGKIRVQRVKTRRTGAPVRTIPICAELQAVLKTVTRRIDDDRVVCATRHEGSDNRHSCATRDWADVLASADVAEYGAPLHALVKSRLTDWARQVTPNTLQALAGHSDITTTLTYYTAAQDDEIDALACTG